MLSRRRALRGVFSTARRRQKCLVPLQSPLQCRTLADTATSSRPSQPAPPAPPTPPETPPAQPVAADAVQRTNPARSPYDYAIRDPGVPPQRGPPEGGGGIHLLVFGLGLAAVPIISYFWYHHRDAHMKAKKEAILKDIQARAQG